MSVAVEIEKLTKSFHVRAKHKTVALNEVDLKIQQGEMVALIGPSGSGKSTLLRHVGGLVQADKTSGPIQVLGETVQCRGKLNSNIRRQRAQIGFIFQQFNLIGRLTVLRNVLLGRLGRTPRWRGSLGLFTHQERAMAVTALQRVGLAELALQRASTLSGGQQQRVAIARALTQQARLLLADEPIASLDPEAARRVMETLKDIHERDKRTVIVTLHQVEYALKYCQRAIALNNGRIVFDGPASELTPATLNNLYGVSHLERVEEAGSGKIGSLQPSAA